MNRSIFHKKFNSDDQNRFAELSGDFNPMHTDPALSRRMLLGGQVVHGLHLVLCALEALFLKLRAKIEPSDIASLRAEFPKPALVGDRVAFSFTQPETATYHLVAHVGSDCVLDLRITLKGRSKESDRATIADAPAQAERLHTLGFDELPQQKGFLKLCLNRRMVKRQFPACGRILSPLVLADLMAMTRLIGMHCPGLNSIFSRIDVQSSADRPSTRFEFKVEDTDARFSLVRIAVKGAKLGGTLYAFFRPPETAQASMADVASRIKRGQFGSSIALVVGGTRGLGEITAKTIAAGGGHCIITYNQGADDAERVVDEIRAEGGRCDKIQLDVSRCEKSLRTLFKNHPKLTSIYYFATPKIFVRRREFFSFKLLRQFHDFYVTYFGNLVDTAASLSVNKLRVFSPSSIAVEETIRDLAEYSMAKRAAEDLCVFYNRHSQSLEILTERLPRVRTDQTTTLTPYPAEEPFDVMYPIIRKMEAPRG